MEKKKYSHVSGYLSVSLTGEGSGYCVYRSISLSIYLMEEEKECIKFVYLLSNGGGD